MWFWPRNQTDPGLDRKKQKITQASDEINLFQILHLNFYFDSSR